jgi:hypothetical protein
MAGCCGLSFRCWWRGCAGFRAGTGAPGRPFRYDWEAVLTPVIDALANREIGTRLFVSPRTVQTHVSHILQKTGLRSRVEIARFAGA